MSKKATLSKEFDGNPCKGFASLPEAIALAEKFSDCRRAVWKFEDGSDHPYMVTRSLDQVARYDGPGSCVYKVWENGVLLVEQEAAHEVPTPETPPVLPPTKLKKVQRHIQETVRNSLAYGDGTFEGYIENLQGRGFDVSGLLAYKAAKGNPEPTIESEPTFAPLPALPTFKQKAHKACETMDSALSVSIFDVIEQLKSAGLSAEKILDVVSGLKPKGSSGQ